ncbi:hypothetical protein SUTMEG_13670 [Sutterella megalosphaeroides]|uniref:Uncharacterized protein n=1 Tax=Sutterella megalosphaeroides TaxID=2494234 RepID=A0A2Z6IFH8_9BURK|nr:hypothetical protein SUTMEG_13670 [Sutterella megalosphaeroides]
MSSDLKTFGVGISARIGLTKAFRRHSSEVVERAVRAPFEPPIAPSADAVSDPLRARSDPTGSPASAPPSRNEAPETRSGSDAGRV